MIVDGEAGRYTVMRLGNLSLGATELINLIKADDADAFFSADGGE